ncbi:hypothetical protein BJ742DRAFT_864629 [Cladochytrium replicatum]|nr:hypothetical protein BJ742DRAFT_864629 [Cladochytrium replicatum]
MDLVREVLGELVCQALVGLALELAGGKKAEACRLLLDGTTAATFKKRNPDLAAFLLSPRDVLNLRTNSKPPSSSGAFYKPKEGFKGHGVTSGSNAPAKSNAAKPSQFLRDVGEPLKDNEYIPISRRNKNITRKENLACAEGGTPRNADQRKPPSVVKTARETAISTARETASDAVEKAYKEETDGESNGSESLDDLLLAMEDREIKQKSSVVQPPEKHQKDSTSQKGFYGKTKVTSLEAVEIKDDEKANIFGLRIRNPTPAAEGFKMQTRSQHYLPLAHLTQLYCQRSSELEDDWVTFGVIASKSSTRPTKTGGKFMHIRLWDTGLSVSKRKASSNDKWGKVPQKSKEGGCFTSLFLFDEALTAHWKEIPGSLIAIVAPKVVPPTERNANVALSLESSDNFIKLGMSSDYGTCQGVRSDGTMCGEVINIRFRDSCDFHAVRTITEAKRKRAELLNGDAPMSLGAPIPKKRKAMPSGTYIFEGGIGGVSLHGKNMNTIFGQQKNSQKQDDVKQKQFNDQNNEMNAQFLNRVLKNGSMGARYLECKKGGGVGSENEDRTALKASCKEHLVLKSPSKEETGQRAAMFERYSEKLIAAQSKREREWREDRERERKWREEERREAEVVNGDGFKEQCDAHVAEMTVPTETEDKREGKNATPAHSGEIPRRDIELELSDLDVDE